jgi:hypothetical protein
MTSGHEASRPLADCPLAERLLYTAFLLLMGTGYLMAITYIYLSHQGHDGKPGLSMEDIVDNYYGNRSGTRLEAAIRGPMAGYIQAEDRHHVVEWLQSGAPERDYAARIQPILAKTCLQCHRPDSGLKIANLSAYAGVRTMAEVDTGMSLLSLVRLSHIHLFGIGLALLAVGLVFRLAQLPEWLKAALVVVPFVSVFADILAWFLTKWDPFYAYTVVTAGAILGLALAAQILISLYQIWFREPPRAT